MFVARQLCPGSLGKLSCGSDSLEPWGLRSLGSSCGVCSHQLVWFWVATLEILDTRNDTPRLYLRGSVNRNLHGESANLLGIAGSGPGLVPQTLDPSPELAYREATIETHGRTLGPRDTGIVNFGIVSGWCPLHHVYLRYSVINRIIAFGHRQISTLRLIGSMKLVSVYTALVALLSARNVAAGSLTPGMRPFPRAARQHPETRRLTWALWPIHRGPKLVRRIHGRPGSEMG